MNTKSIPGVPSSLEEVKQDIAAFEADLDADILETVSHQDVMKDVRQNARFLMTCEWKKTAMAELTKATKYCAKNIRRTLLVHKLFKLVYYVDEKKSVLYIVSSLDVLPPILYIDKSYS